MNLYRRIYKMGNDTVVLIEGGIGHIGSVVICTPYKKENKWHVTYSMINQTGHKDDAVAIQYAKAMSMQTHTITTCICGIHFESISKKKIDEILTWVKHDLEQLKEEQYV